MTAASIASVSGSARASGWGVPGGWDSGYYGGGFWATSNLRRPGWSKMRASDADRDRVAAQLREHCVTGRLSVDELSDRLESVFKARTYGELAVPLRDLPEERPHLSAPVVRRRRHHHGLRIAFFVIFLVWVAAHASTVTWHGAAFGLALVVLMAVAVWRIWRLTSPAWWRRAVLEPGVRGARRYVSRRLSDHV